MLRIRVCENEEIRLDRPIPEEYRDIGCVFLLQETFVATLSYGGSVECGSFHVTLTDDDPADRPAASGTKVSAGRSDVVRPATADLSDEDRIAEGESTQLCGAAPTTLSEHTSPVTLQVHPRIPGYDLQALLGRGGMGLVWKAVQLSTNRMVAVKTIHPRMLGDAKNQKRFQREVELAARLNHPNIVRVYEAGDVLGQNYFSMELVDGVPWSQYVRSHRPGKTVVLRQLLQVLDAVSYAHAQGVVHRDLKPSNILIDKSGKVYVVDFGLAKHSAGEGEQLSQQGDVIGTLTFMSPEQASGDISLTDSRSDVYSLGAVIMYLLGNGLSVDKIPGQDKKRVRDDDALQKCAAGALRNDPRLRRILVKALAPQPEQRYQDAGAFASDLREYLEDRLTEVHQTQGKRQKRTLAWVWLAIVPLLLLGAAASILFWKDPLSILRPTSSLDTDELATVPPEPIDPPPDFKADVIEAFGDGIFPTFATDGQKPTFGRATIGIGTQDEADHYIVHPGGWPFVGFQLITYDFKGDLIVKAMQPIFRDPATGQIAKSQWAGRPHAKGQLHQVVAQPGYRVCGLEAVGGERIYALKVVFRADGSEPSVAGDRESYESPWYGQGGYRQSEMVGGSEALAIGFLCSFKADMHQVALILEE